MHIDTCGCECEEFNTGVQSASKGNLGEAVIVDKVITNLIKTGLLHKDIGVITPYSLQVRNMAILKYLVELNSFIFYDFTF